VSHDHVIAAVIQAICQIMDAPECLLLLGTSSSNTFLLRHGQGTLFKALGAKARIDVRDRTVLGVCLLRKENIMIHHAHDPKITAYLPDWLKGLSALGAFALLPLVDDKTAHGVMLVGWPTSRQIVLSPDQVNHIRSLLTMASTSCRRLAA
jgi:signal transduction protein with GAF and PtsI domain